MKGFKFTSHTKVVALIFFSAYLIYGLLYLPFRQYLTCLAVGGIAYGISNSYEIATLSLFAMNLLFSAACGRSEGFTDGSGNTLVAAGLRKPASASASGSDVKGVSGFKTEGFEDAAEEDLTLDTEGAGKEEEESEVSKPAPAPSPSEEEEAPAKAKKAKKAKKAAGISEQGIPPAMQPQEEETFQDNGGLFKLGQIPKDVKGGFHIDAGTTVINALKSLKPDQIASMTNDTKQLIETQKSLMNMLNTFKPMMSEGKEMMNTFQQMFTPSAGAQA